MLGWRHRLDGHESEQAPGDSEGQGSLACCSSWDCRVRHDLATEQQPSALCPEYKPLYYFSPVGPRVPQRVDST